MKKIDVPLFRGIPQDEWEKMKQACAMRKEHYGRNQVIFHQGDRVRELGLVLSGTVHIESVDLWGNRSILSAVSPGQVFGETYALTGEPLMVTALAAGEAEILRVGLGVLLQPGLTGSLWQERLLRNMLAIFAEKNRILSGRMFCTSSKTVRGRLLTYLSAQAVHAGSSTFAIPFNRQQLADYLNVDRSALSKELGRMQAEGMLRFRKNRFELLQISELGPASGDAY